jgi:tripartite-type tricarboxylate transporter receptor subunit TctC
MQSATTTARALAALAFLCGAPAVLAQAFPSKPIRLVVGFTPGGGVDINARLLGPKLTEYLGQPVVVENRPGAGTNIANELVAKSPPDGYTLLVNTAALAINLSLYKKVNYEAKDFAPISILSMSPNILVVHTSVPVKNVKELIALARSRPGKLNYSSAGAGTTQHLSGELFNLKAGIKTLHIPYKGSAPSLTAVISGEVDLTYANIPAISAHVKAGRLRGLANLGPKRSDQLPQVPTMKEAGVPGVEVTVWYGLFAPAATPRDAVNRLAEAIARAARAPDMQQKLVDLGAEPVGNSPDEFGKLFREEIVRWAEVVKVSGAQEN